MASWLVNRIFWITCFAVVLYAFPSMDGNGTASYLKKNPSLEETAKQETLGIRDHEAVLIAIRDSEEFVALSGTDELNSGMIDTMNVSRCDVKNKTGHCVRDKRSVRRDYPHFCDDTSLDTITRIRNGYTYLFKGNHYWKLHNHAIPEGYPRNISDDWDGLEGPLDASYTTHTGETYFFKGSQFWKFVNKQKKTGYPKQISAQFRGIPDDVDAVFCLKNNQQIYFFKGKKYWLLDRRLEPPVHRDYPKLINETWGHLLRKGIDAAFRWQDERVYFFKDDLYYQYNFDTFRVVEADPPYPRESGPVWFDCR